MASGRRFGTPVTLLRSLEATAALSWHHAAVFENPKQGQNRGLRPVRGDGTFTAPFTWNLNARTKMIATQNAPVENAAETVHAGAPKCVRAH